MEILRHQEDSQPIGQWGIKLEQERGFPVLILQNRLSNGSNRFPPSFVRIQFHPLSEDVIFQFRGSESRLVATPGELNFLMEREGLPKIFAVDLEVVFDDWRQANQQLTTRMDDFWWLCQSFQETLEESLVIPVSFYERQTCIFLYHDRLVNSQEIGLQGRFDGQEKQMIDELNHWLSSVGDIKRLKWQDMAISDYAINNGQWLGVRSKDGLQVAVFDRAGAVVDVCTWAVLPSSCLAIFDRWKKLANCDPADEQNFGLAHWLAAQRLS